MGKNKGQFLRLEMQKSEVINAYTKVCISLYRVYTQDISICFSLGVNKSNKMESHALKLNSFEIININGEKRLKNV